MSDFWKNLTRNWQDTINLLLGLWLLVSAWVLAFTGIPLAFWNAIAFGIVIAVLAFAALMEWREWEEWGDMAIGAWLFVSPWVLGFAAFAPAPEGAAYAATWNMLIVGVLTLAMAAWSVVDHRQRETRAH